MRSQSGDIVLDCTLYGLGFNLYWNLKKPLYFYSPKKDFITIENKLCFKIHRNIYYGQVSIKVKSKAIFVYKNCEYNENKINAIRGIINENPKEFYKFLSYMVDIINNGKYKLDSSFIRCIQLFETLRSNEVFKLVVDTYNKKYVSTNDRNFTKEINLKRKLK